MKIIVITITTCLLAALIIHETTRWFESVRACNTMWYQNALFLNSTSCKGFDDHGPQVAKACDAARDENANYRISCTARLYLRGSGAYHLYSMFAESHWMLFGLTSVFMVLVVNWLNTRSLIKTMEKYAPKQKQVDEVPFMLPPPPLPLQEQPRKRVRRTWQSATGKTFDLQ